VTIHGATQDLAIAGIERGVKGESAVAVILEAMAFGAPRRRRQHRIKPVKSLNGRLFIDAKHGGMLQWAEVKPDDAGCLLLKRGIVAGQVAFQPLGSQTSPWPNPRHHHVTDAEFCRQFAGAPVGRTIAGLLPSLGQNPGFKLGRALERGPVPHDGCRVQPDVFATNRFGPSRIKRVLQPNKAWIASQVKPAASSTISRARRTKSARVFRPLTSCFSSAKRSDRLRRISILFRHQSANVRLIVTDE
jgi:hypothetical protein